MFDPHRIDSVDALRTHYREPSQLVVDKVRTRLDEATTAFVDTCRFAVLATEGPDGLPDASPRGGPSGFIRVLDQPQYYTSCYRLRLWPGSSSYCTSVE